MTSITLRRASRKDGEALLTLIDALADYEKLKRPNAAARKRLLRDAFGRRKRFSVILALTAGKAVGYAIYFETYSSFLALPTLYLEDIFVLEEYRHRKIGLRLFRACRMEGKKHGCGRMEWMVLDWNKPAVRFYNRIGARRMKEWLLFRLKP